MGRFNLVCKISAKQGIKIDLLLEYFNTAEMLGIS
jgi:hypothetical protein